MYDPGHARARACAEGVGSLAAWNEAIDGIRQKVTQRKYAQKHEGAPPEPFVEEAERGLEDLVTRVW